MKEWILLFIGAALVNNVVLSRFLGLCPFLGVSKKVETSIGMGMAVIFVITISSIFANIVYTLILVPFHIAYLQTIVFISVIAGLVQFVEMVLKKKMPKLYEALGVFLPLITTNCAVLGVALDNVVKGHGFLQSVIYGMGTSCGFAISIILLAGLRERIQIKEVPKNFQGMPIVLITAGLMAIAFFGFAGLI